MKINGTTYMCEQQCSIDLGPPIEVSDCCGGWWAVISKEAIEVT